MNIEQIRSKYKQILEEPESQNSQDEWELAYSQMQKKRKKRILTESNSNSCNKPKKSINGEESSVLLGVKEKLAQCLSNLGQKNKEIAMLKEESIRQIESNRRMEDQVKELKNKIESQNREMSQKQNQINQLESNLTRMQEKIEELTIDKELTQKQIEFYKEQIEAMKTNLNGKARQFMRIQKEIKHVEKIKSDNSKLKDDIARLYAIIDDSYRFGKVSAELLKKHFLGKPYKEFDFWYPQNLIGEVEFFLKRHQIGYGNKQFTNSLIKFIDKYTKQVTKQNQKRVKLSCSSRIKQVQRKHQRSNSIQAGDSLPKSCKKMSSSLLRRTLHMPNLNAHSFNFWRTNTESRITQKLQKSISLNKMRERSLQTSNCFEILHEFKLIMHDLLEEKQIKRRKIMKIIESMSLSIFQAFERKEKQTIYIEEHSKVTND